MSERYRVHGITLASGLSFPHLPSEPDLEDRPPDLVLDFEPHASLDPHLLDRSTLLHEHRTSGYLSLSVFQLDRGFLFRYHRGIDFIIDAGLERVTCRSTSDIDEELIRYLFLSLVAAFILHRRGRPVLHAAAVDVSGEAAAFVAPPGHGKSSFTTYCVTAGCPLLSDDVLALELSGDRVMAHPGPPQLRLWPDSLAKLWGDPAEWPRHALQTEKRQIWLPQTDRFYCARPLPLRAIYILERADVDAPALTAFTARETMVALVSSSFGNFLSDAEGLSRQLQWFGRAIPYLACRRLRIPSDFDRLSDALEAVRRDLATLPLHGIS